METPIQMDDLGVPLFLETPKYVCSNLKIHQRSDCLSQVSHLYLHL